MELKLNMVQKHYSMEDLWTAFCGNSECASEAEKECISGSVSLLSLLGVILHHNIVDSAKTVKDILSLPGAALWLVCAFQGHKYAESDHDLCDLLFVNLCKMANPVLPVITAQMTMSLLLLKLDFLAKPILVSGFFALVKVLYVSTGPLFLKALINLTKGKSAFKYEGYALAVGLFIAKCLESISERQWFYRTSSCFGHTVCDLISPLVKLLHKYQRKLIVAQDKRLKAMTEGLANMKVLKLYAWERHFQNVIEVLRKDQTKRVVEVLSQKRFNVALFWSSSIIASAATFSTCYFRAIPLSTTYIFTVLATLCIVQEPIRFVSDAAGAFIEAKDSSLMLRYLEAPELQSEQIRLKCDNREEPAISTMDEKISWQDNSEKPTLTNINIVVRPGEKVAICGEVHVNEKIAYVSHTAWIQTGTIHENILFGSPMDSLRCQEVLRKSSLVKDLEMLPMGEETKLEKEEYVMGALSGNTVILVAHQVDFFPAFDCILLVLSDGVPVKASSYEELMASSKEFQNLVNSQNEAIDSKKHAQNSSSQRSRVLGKEIQNYDEEQFTAFCGDQLIKQEEREIGDNGLKPYIQYVKHNKSFLYFSLAIMSHIAFTVGQYIHNYLLASDIRDGFVGRTKLIITYLVICCILTLFLLLRSFFLVILNYKASESIFPELLSSLFRAPMAFYDSTPLGRMLTRVSSDMSIMDLEVVMKSNFAVGMTIVVYFSYTVLVILSWPVLFKIIPIIYLTAVLKVLEKATQIAA
ncbi:hypothetical protein FEM48_Zijuj11G0020600 [Ziziphus jujuba var. spinosa]|uniref:ABC transmembrane type-1 domain-containing protein n=1 Tax=Ziziphus jujuba var. spinosa TaxID=714518 RepID=A0A978UG70_ZIZJJ|nr:hypothetical protein FEM48_Zijuj11G0020600 [Ziziphus jujuba var. spinosa]